MTYTTQTYQRSDRTTMYCVTGTGASPAFLEYAKTHWAELADHNCVYTVHQNPDHTKTVKIWLAT